MICPCKHCEDAGCGSYHDKCQRYKEWREELDEKKAKRHAAGELKQLSRDHEMKYRRNLKNRR